MRRDNDPTIPQLAVPVTVPKHMFKAAKQASAKEIAIANLAIIAVFYLLRVGEYTQPRQVKKNGRWKQATRTVQFRVQDIGFFKDGKILPRHS